MVLARATPHAVGEEYEPPQRLLGDPYAEAPGLPSTGPTPDGAADGLPPPTHNVAP
jgi:hypothetical protein